MVGDCCLILILILLPPLGVFLMKGCDADFWINVCLTILGYIPGKAYFIACWPFAWFLCPHQGTRKPSNTRHPIYPGSPARLRICIERKAAPNRLTFVFSLSVYHAGIIKTTAFSYAWRTFAKIAMASSRQF
ncbi:hypothetical protein VTP01DRAFT_5469 [Rhizomucor pusillus]|uniref:uncharacterized protein n=1 Tax=Rhizomucor pusillus TaxID=4840 RepID=UPI003742BD6F